MKKLQSNYTTPEQSKRLLELGVPADSADMWWEKDEAIRINGEWIHGAAWNKVPFILNWDRDNNRFFTYSETKKVTEDFVGNDTLPCWSVGRLMEIYLLSVEMETNIKPNAIFFLGDNKSLMENLMEWFKTESFDFSKLED